MAKVLFLIPPSHNHMNPTLGVAKELHDRGENVVYFSSETMKRKVESLGASFRPYPELPWYGENSNADTGSYGLEGFIVQAAGFLYGNKKSTEVMVNLVSAEKPDYLVHDSYCLWGKQVAKRLGIPAIASIATPAFNMNIKDIDPKRFVKYVLRSSDPALSDRIGEIIQNLELKFKKSFDIDDFLDIFVAKEALNIVYTSKYFQIYHESFDDSFKFVGASVLPRNETIEFPYERLNGKPVIYIAMGGVVSQHADFYQKCIDAFRTSDVQVILSLGKIDPGSLSGVPEHFILSKYVPQLDILQRAKLFISHGGINSVSEALYYNLPMVMVPYFGDQCWIAKRVEDLGAGIYLDPKLISISELREAADRILTHPAFYENSKKIGDSLRLAGGYAKAADEILSFKAQKGIG